jgi:hypothetical protein
LQDLRHQGPDPEHQLGGARGRRRAELSEYVKRPRAEPDRQRAALAQASLVGRPVRHLVASLRNSVATVGIVFVRHGQTRRSGRSSPSIQSYPRRQQRHPCTKPSCATLITAWPTFKHRVILTLLRQTGPGDVLTNHLGRTMTVKTRRRYKAEFKAAAPTRLDEPAKH